MPPPHTATRSDPAAVLRRNRERAGAFAQQAGKAPVRTLLERAQADLIARLSKAAGLKGPGTDSFTAVQLRVTLEQIKDVLTPLQDGMKATIVQHGTEAAQTETSQLVGYLNDSETKYRGVAQGLQINEAAIMHKAVSGTESSILARIETNPKDPRRPGVLARYGASVIADFETELQMRFLAKTPWEDVKKALVEKSPFLQGAPAHWAERIVRTEVMNANNRAGLETIKAANTQLGDMCKILCATFDNRTGADSYAVHGQIRRPSESFESWFGSYAHPPNRPNDREVVVPHRVCWPIPPELKPKSSGEIAKRWAQEGRKGSPPAQPKISTIDLTKFGNEDPPPVAKPPELGPELIPPTERQPGGPSVDADAQADTERASTPKKRKRAPRSLPGAPEPDELDLPLPTGIEAPSGYEDDPLAVGGRVPVFPGARTGMQALGVGTLYRRPAQGEHVRFDSGSMGKMKAAPAKGPLRPYAAALKSLGKAIDALVEDHGESVEVNDSALREVQATKRAVDRRAVASLIAKPVPHEDAAPVYVKHEGKIFLHSGHEQLMAAHLGTTPRSMRPSKLIDLDKLKPGPKVEPKVLARSLSTALSTSSTELPPKEQKQVRDDLRALLHGHGIPTREDRYRDGRHLGRFPGATDQGDGMNAYVVDKQPSWVSGANGSHGWNGDMEIATDTHRQAQIVFRKLAIGDIPRTVERIDEIGTSVRTLVHEQVHGASKAQPSAYSGLGIGMEEAATEIIARKITRELFGHAKPTGESFALPTLQPGGTYEGGTGSYGNYISGLLNTVSQVTGHEDIHARVEQAVLKTRAWGKGERYSTPTDSITDFAHSLTDNADHRRALITALTDHHFSPFRQ